MLDNMIFEFQEDTKGNQNIFDNQMLSNWL